MHERIHTPVTIHTSELTQHTRVMIIDYCDLIHDQFSLTRVLNVHHPWLPDDPVSVSRLTNTMHNLECGGVVGPVERYVEYTLATSIEALKTLPEDNNKLRQEIGVFIGHGLAVLHELNPEKANRVQTILDTNTK